MDRNSTWRWTLEDIRIMTACMGCLLREDMESLSALQAALLSGDLNVIESMLGIVRRGNEMKNVMRCQKIINVLLAKEDNNFNTSNNYSLLLHFAAFFQDNKSFNLLLETTNYNVNATLLRSNFTLMHVVATWGNYQMGKALLERGANVNAKVYKSKATPLHLACSVFHLNFCTRQHSPAFLRDTVGDPRMVQLLINHGASLNQRLNNIKGDTPLFLAFHSRYLDIVQVLLQNGADFNIKLRDGQTLLHEAVSEGSIDVVKLLLDEKVNVNVRGCKDRTPIYGIQQVTSSDDYEAILELLVKNGADVNTEDIYGYTPLHHLCTSVFSKGVLKSFIIKAKPDINALNVNKETPFDVLMEFAKSVLEEILDLYFGVPETLCAYIVQLKATNKYVCQRNLNLLENFEKIQDFHHACELEIKLMKQETISPRFRYYYFDLFTINPRKSVAFARNKEMMKILATENYKVMFPIYGDYLANFIYEAEVRRDLNRVCGRLLQEFACERDLRILPDCVVDHICTYLSEKNLRNIEKCFT